jgi:hypothetical protein
MNIEDENEVLGCGKTRKECDEIFDNHFNTFKFDGLTVEETREICTLDYTYSQGYDRSDTSIKRYTELSSKRIWK